MVGEDASPFVQDGSRSRIAFYFTRLPRWCVKESELVRLEVLGYGFAVVAVADDG